MLTPFAKKMLKISISVCLYFILAMVLLAVVPGTFAEDGTRVVSKGWQAFAVVVPAVAILLVSFRGKIFGKKQK